MSVFVDDGEFYHNQRASIVVHEDTRSAKVTYQNEDGKRFRVMVHQKPNPIGFHARLPGDRKR